MSGMLALPKDRKELAECLKSALTDSRMVRNQASVEWQIAHAYLRGERGFWVYNQKLGDVRIGFENDQSEWEFRHEQILREYRTEFGRLMKMDLNPTVKGVGFGLSALRRGAMGQATVDYMKGGVGMEAVKSRFVQALLIFGTAGLNHYRGDGRTIAQRTCVEVVSPFEILGVPARTVTLEDVRAWVRERWVTLEWLLERRKGRGDEEGLALGDSEERLGVQEQPFGVFPALGGVRMGSSSQGLSLMGVWEKRWRQNVSKARTQSGGGLKKSKDKNQKWVLLEEWFLLGDKQDVVRSILKAGDVIAGDIDFLEEGAEEEALEGEEGAEAMEAQPVPLPLGVGRYTPTGTVYGRGFVGQQMSQNAETEALLSSVYQNVRDMDHFGLTVVRASSGIRLSDVKKPERRKVLVAETDPVYPQADPVQHFAPFNSGDFPGKVAQMAMQSQRELSGQGEMYQAGTPGRVDSAAALGFLYETGNVGMVATGSEMAEAFVTLYKSMLRAAKNEARDSFVFPLPDVDERFIGLALEMGPKGAEVRVGKNPVPDLWDVVVDVRDRSPVSRERRRQEALQMLEIGLMDPVQFEILNFKEQFEFPIHSQVNWETYRRTVFQAILLFGDGETPGEYRINEKADRPDVMLPILERVMVSLEFFYANAAVRAAFEQWKDDLLGVSGRRVPEALPPPDVMGEVLKAAGAGKPGGPGMGGMGMGAGMSGAQGAQGMNGAPQGRGAMQGAMRR